MFGRMQEWPLLMHKIIDFAAIQFPDREVASRMVEGPMHRTNYREVRDRALKVAKRLERDGIRLGDRVATLAWNGFRHLEAWYGITGVGAIYHTVNPRLFPEQIAWIVNHAEDRIVMTDLTFVPLLEAIADHLPTVERYIVLTDAAHMPATKLRNAVAYEDWIGEVDSDFEWKAFDERTAAGLCYTSGTTGNPKGVLYSHRSNILHSMMAAGPETLTLNAYDSVLPVVPMFHANSWGLALACPVRGARMVMPGAKLDGASVHDLLETEKVTMTAAVPTVWLGLLHYMRKEGKRLSTLKLVVIGGSACPPDMIRAFEDDYGVEVRHAWGMTEMSPLGSAVCINRAKASLSHEEKLAIQSKQGWAPFGVEMKIVDDENNDVAVGRQALRPAESEGLRRRPRAISRTRAARSSTTTASSTPATSPPSTPTASCRSPTAPRTSSSPAESGSRPSTSRTSPSGIRTWRRRRSSASPTPSGTSGRCWSSCRRRATTPKTEEVLAFLKPKIAKWWMPDDVQVVKEIPHTATGKINKLKLRETFKGYKLPTE